MCDIRVDYQDARAWRPQTKIIGTKLHRKQNPENNRAGRPLVDMEDDKARQSCTKQESSGRRNCSERKRKRSIPGRRLEGAEDSNPYHSELEKLQTDEERNERILHRDEMKWEKPAGFSIHSHVMCVPQGLMRRRKSNPGCVLSLKKKRKTVFMGEKGHQE